MQPDQLALNLHLDSPLMGKAKNDRNLMVYAWFGLNREKQTELPVYDDGKVRIEVTGTKHGVANIWDAELLIYLASIIRGQCDGTNGGRLAEGDTDQRSRDARSADDNGAGVFDRRGAGGHRVSERAAALAAGPAGGLLRCDLSCRCPITPGIGGVRPDKERSASQREDPIHLGAATWQCGGVIRRTKRREQRAEAWEPRSGSALAETGRLSASECPFKVRQPQQAQEAGGLDQNGTRVGPP